VNMTSIQSFFSRKQHIVKEPRAYFHQRSLVSFYHVNIQDLMLGSILEVWSVLFQLSLHIVLVIESHRYRYIQLIKRLEYLQFATDVPLQ
jgi:hypothetical protein